MAELARIAAFLVPVVVPVMGLVALGRVAVVARLVDPAAREGITNLVFWFLLPALLFGSVANGGVGAGGLETDLVYFGVALPLYGAAVALGRFGLKLTGAQAAVFGLNAVYGNVVMMGVPIAEAVWGRPGLSTLLSIVAAHSLVLLPLATLLVEFSASSNGSGPARRGGLLRALARPVLGSLTNPIITSILLAYAWWALGVPLPEAIRRFLDSLGAAAPALALICLGTSLPGLKGAHAPPAVLLATAVKLVLMPLCMAGAVWLAGVPAPASAVLIVTAALPTGANAFLLARKAQSMMSESAATTVLATLGAALTLSAALVLTHGP